MREFPLRDEEGQPIGKVILEKERFETPPSVGYNYERLPDGELEFKDFLLKSNDKLKRAVPRVPPDFA